MPGTIAPDEEAPPSLNAFTILSQKIELDVDFAPRQIKGKVEITIQPTVKDLRTVKLNARQLEIADIKVEGRKAKYSYGDLYQRLRLYPTTGLYQYHFPKERTARHKNGEEDELTIYFPGSVSVQDADPFAVAARADLLGGSFKREAAGPGAVLETPAIRTVEDGYLPIKIEIEYRIRKFRDALQFVGLEESDSRYPHLYTRNSSFPGTACCLFPCLDDSYSRCLYEISIRCPRTLGDVFPKALSARDNPPGQVVNGDSASHLPNGIHKADSPMELDDDSMGFSEEEKSLDMAVICSGDMTDEIIDPADPTRKTVSFFCPVSVLAHHIGFTIGPFEHVDLSDFRDTEDDERLGSNAIRVHGFCLPGRAEEVVNSCMMFAKAIDKFTEKYMSYPFTSYKICFVDDLPADVADTASLSICSTRLLFPETIWDPLERVTRTLIHALASQWLGISVIPQDPQDRWIIVGGSWFMTDFYLKDLFGRNDYKFRQKRTSDEVVRLDHKRASIFALGQYLAIDPAEVEFMELKAPLVLSILHHRLVKQSGKNGIDRCFWKLFLNARAGKIVNSAISTDAFFEICEKVGHQKLEVFFNQWVFGAGCPQFECAPSFNKKKLVVALTIRQVQGDSTLGMSEEFMNSSDFMREAKEQSHGVQQEPLQNAFIGPMTIRIHEADGTPYEHIVDITSATTKVEIPYNTKYKRLKRSRRQKERAAAAQGVDLTGDTQDDVLLYCLGDVLQSEEEVAEWRLSDWSKEDEEKMAQESYEWLRIDADFEWICKTQIVDMPSYMYVSQLQQDKDIIAQVESIQYLALKAGHPLISSILVRTLMDGRYYHGIRTLAASVIAASAKEDLDWIGFFHLEKAFQELFCSPGSPMTRTNDFSDRALYLIQCAIPEAISTIRDNNGVAPMRVKRFLLDKLGYNDNRGNEYSDDHYVANLMSCLASSLTTGRGSASFQYSMEDEADQIEFQRKALDELGRLQRVDEWIPSFQNVYTTTALECSLSLMKNYVLPRKLSMFLPYVRVGNADNVRLAAWRCMIELGAIRNGMVVKLMLHSIESEPSSYYRGELLRIFGKAMGQLAFGELKELDDRTGTGFIIEQESAGREADLARKSTIGSAISALRQDYGAWEPLQQAMEEALRSETTSVNEVEELLEVCSMLYTQIDQLEVKCDYPRYWKVEHQGRGKLRFYKTDKVRSTQMTPLSRKLDALVVAKPTGMKISFKPTQAHAEKTKREKTGTVVLPPRLPVTSPPVQHISPPSSNADTLDTITLSPSTQKKSQTQSQGPEAPPSVTGVLSTSSFNARTQSPAIVASPPSQRPLPPPQAVAAPPKPSPKPPAKTSAKTSTKPSSKAKKSKVVVLKVNSERLGRILRSSPAMFPKNPTIHTPVQPAVNGTRPGHVGGTQEMDLDDLPLSLAATNGTHRKKRPSPFNEDVDGQPPLKRQASSDAVGRSAAPPPKSKVLKLKLNMNKNKKKDGTS